jgi:hypothetical protein
MRRRWAKRGNSWIGFWQISGKTLAASDVLAYVAAVASAVCEGESAAFMVWAAGARAWSTLATVDCDLTVAVPCYRSPVAPMWPRPPSIEGIGIWPLEQWKAESGRANWSRL